MRIPNAVRLGDMPAVEGLAPALKTVNELSVENATAIAGRKARLQSLDARLDAARAKLDERKLRIELIEAKASVVARDAEWLRHLEDVHRTFRKYWPMHWPAFEACLAAIISLLLDKVSQGLGIVLVGDSGAGKGTILDAFQQDVEFVIWRDKFTAASLLSGFADASRKAVDERALFRAVKHQALVVGDLGPLVSADKNGQNSLYSVIPPWLDGRGLVFDTGTHGVIGAKGDFSFVLLGAKTPFDIQTHRAMSQMGLRLLFLRIPRLEKNERIPSELYEPAKEEIHTATTGFLNWVSQNYGRRSLSWPVLHPVHESRLGDYAQLMADAQTLSRDFSGSEIIRPTPNHLLQRLAIIVRARALLWRRGVVDENDLSLAKRFVRASGPGQRGRVLLALFEGADEAHLISEATHVPYATVDRTLKELAQVEVVRQGGIRPRSGKGQPATVWILSEWVDPERELMRVEDEEQH